MDRVDTALRGISKSLRDAVLPAVDPADPLAQDQLGLVVRYVDFLRDRIDLLHGRERAELRYQAGIAAILLELAPEASAAGCLAVLAEAARQALADPEQATSDIRDCRDQLGTATTKALRELGRTGKARAIRHAVLARSRTRITRERLWFQPLGFDQMQADPAQLRPLLQHDPTYATKNP